MKLTPAQLSELRRLAVEPQYTFGSHRARVQRNLYKLKLATFVDENNKPARLINIAERCVITDLGQTVLQSVEGD